MLAVYTEGSRIFRPDHVPIESRQATPSCWCTPLQKYTNHGPAYARVLQPVSYLSWLAPASYFPFTRRGAFTRMHGTVLRISRCKWLLASLIERIHTCYLASSFACTSRCIHACMALRHISFSPKFMKKPASFFGCMYVTAHMYLHRYFPFFICLVVHMDKGVHMDFILTKIHQTYSSIDLRMLMFSWVHC